MSSDFFQLLINTLLGDKETKYIVNIIGKARTRNSGSQVNACGQIIKTAVRLSYYPIGWFVSMVLILWNLQLL